MKRKTLFMLSLLCLSFAAVPDKAHSEGNAYQTHTCGSGSWFRNYCWSLGNVPADGEKVSMSASDSAPTVTFDSDAVISLFSLHVGGFVDSSYSNITLDITAPGASIEAGDLKVGSSDGTDAYSMSIGSHGAIVQEAGVVWATPMTGALGELIIGNRSPDSGSYMLSGGNLHTVGTVVGNNGTGTFTHDGATGSDVNHFTDTLTIGSEPGSDGVYNLGAGHLTSHEMIVGDNGTGEFVQSAPLNSYNTTGILTVGNNSTGVGNYDMQGGWLSADYEAIGNDGAGTFTQWGGLNDVAENLFLGHLSGGNGTYSMMGMFGGDPELRAGNEYVGLYGSGAFEQFGGTNTVAGGLYVGYGSDASGSYVLDGGGTLSAADVVVGHNGDGTFTQYVGTSTIGSSLVVGNNAGSTGTYNMNDGMLLSGDITVGRDGTGVFNQINGNNWLFPNGIINVGSGSGDGTYNMSGLGLSATYMNIGTGTGTGEFNITGGFTNIYETLAIGANGTFSMSNGGGFFAPDLWVGSILNDGTINFSGGSITTASGQCSYCPPGLPTGVVNNGVFNISGAGERVVNGSVENNGTIKVTDTTVVYTGDFTDNGAYISDPSSNYFSNLTIGSDGYLVGGVGDNFFLTGDFFNYSTQVSLWDTADAYLGFYGWDSHEFYLGGWDETSSMSFSWDTLELSEYGNLFFSGGLGAALYVDNLILGAGSMLDLNGFNLYYSSLTDLGGSFSNGQLIYLAANTGGGSTSVPEPSTFLLLGSGLAGLGLAGWRKRAKKD